MKPAYFIKVLLIIGIGCTSSNNVESVIIKSNKLKEDSSKLKVIDFNVFLKKFNNDSLFQISCIDFPLSLISFEDDVKKKSTIIRSEWSFIQLIENDKYNSKIIKKVKTKYEVEIQYLIEDTGILVCHFFAFKNGLWRLERIEDYSN